MRTADASQVQWEQISQHRKESPWFRRLLQGPRGELDNYEFALVRVDERYDTPRHNHNFDQVRIMLEGAFDFGGQVQTAGTIGYFPAGTHYTQSARGASITLLLQVGAACQQGYLDFGQVREAAAELARSGEFIDGIYHYTDEDGTQRSEDGYDAVFRHAAGFKAEIPEPRFENPVIVNTDAVPPLPSEDGGQTRFFGTFNEYGLSLSQRLGTAGEVVTLRPRKGQKALFYVVDGSLEDADLNIEPGVAIELMPEEAVAGTVTGDLAVFQIDLPQFQLQQRDAAA